MLILFRMEGERVALVGWIREVNFTQPIRSMINDEEYQHDQYFNDDDILISPHCPSSEEADSKTTEAAFPS